MAERLSRPEIAEKAIIHEAPEFHQSHTVDRSFELPAVIYGTTVALFFAAAGVMAFGFGSPMLVVPTGIIAVFLTMFFAVPALWMRMQPRQSQTLTSWSRFRRNGIVTAYGHTTAGAATIQVLILPSLIFVWAVAVVVIATMVR